MKKVDTNMITCKNDYIPNAAKNEDRMDTKKYRLVLFIFLFAIWAASCGYVISSGFCSTLISINNTEIKRNMNHYFKNDIWLFDILTYNFTFDTNLHYNTPESESEILLAFWLITALGGYVHLAVIALLLHSLMYITHSIRKYLFLFYVYTIVMSIGFMLISTIYHLGLNVVSDLIPDLLCYKKFVFWVSPEFGLFVSILIMILYMLCVDATCARSSCKIMLRCCCDLCCVTILAVILTVTMISVKVITAWLVHNLSWTDLLLYIILSGSCYLTLFIYCFGNAVIATAIWNSNKKRVKCNALLLAIYTVTKHHIGSVAFHATIFLPVLVIMRTKSKIWPEIERNNLEKIKLELTSRQKLWSELPNFACLDIKYECSPTHDKGYIDRNIGRAWEFSKKPYYILKAFRRSLLFVVVYARSYQDSSEIILSRYFRQEHLPHSRFALRGWLGIYVFVNLIHACSQSVRFDLSQYSQNYIILYNINDARSFDLVATVAYFKISTVMFLLISMIFENYEMIVNLRQIEEKENFHGKDNQSRENVIDVV